MREETFNLTQFELDELRKPNENVGGFQSLMKNLQARVDNNNNITLTADLKEKIRHYAFGYGNGGWQKRLKYIFSRHLGENLDQ